MRVKGVQQVSKQGIIALINVALRFQQMYFSKKSA